MEQRTIAPAETHHGFINGGIAMGVETHSLHNNVCGLGSAARQQPHFIHGIEQLPVRGLKAVDLRNRTRHDYAHGIRHEVDFQRLGDGLLYNLRMQSHDVGIVLMLVFFFFFLFCHYLHPPFLGNIRQLQKLVAVFGDVILAPLEVVALQ